MEVVYGKWKKLEPNYFIRKGKLVLPTSVGNLNIKISEEIIDGSHCIEVENISGYDYESEIDSWVKKLTEKEKENLKKVLEVV